jgi:hypothetical protein
MAHLDQVSKYYTWGFFFFFNNEKLFLTSNQLTPSPHQSHGLPPIKLHNIFLILFFAQVFFLVYWILIQTNY